MTDKAPVTGTIVDYDPADALGWIQIAGEHDRVRFAVGALDGFDRPPAIGAAVCVVGTTVGFRGMRKAVRVTPAGFVEPPALDPKAILLGLGLDPDLVQATWPATHARAVEAYRVTADPARLDRDRAFAITDPHDPAALCALLTRWLGQPMPRDTDEAILFAADLLAIRDAHGAGEPGRGPQLFELSGETGRLYVVRTWGERLAVPGGERLAFATCVFPDTDSAFNGIYRYDGVSPAFALHAPDCAICQAQLRDVIAQFGQDTLSSDFLALVR